MFSRLKSWHLFFLLPVICLILWLYLSLGKTSSGPGGKVIKRLTPFAGGKFEASGVVGVPGSEGVLFVDNGRKGQVFWMRLDQDGKQSGAINALDLGVGIEDLEGITTDGTYFYVISSQSRPKAIVD
jgi:hypothetical protein